MKWDEDEAEEVNWSAEVSWIKSNFHKSFAVLTDSLLRRGLIREAHSVLFKLTAAFSLVTSRDSYNSREGFSDIETSLRWLLANIQFTAELGFKANIFHFLISLENNRRTFYFDLDFFSFFFRSPSLSNCARINEELHSKRIGENKNLQMCSQVDAKLWMHLHKLLQNFESFRSSRKSSENRLWKCSNEVFTWASSDSSFDFISFAKSSSLRKRFSRSEMF